MTLHTTLDAALLNCWTIHAGGKYDKEAFKTLQRFVDDLPADIGRRVAEAVAAERERCYELAAEEQLYPNDADCSAVNGVVQRLMTRIENGTTIDDLRSNAAMTGPAGVHVHEPVGQKPRTEGDK